MTNLDPIYGIRRGIKAGGNIRPTNIRIVKGEVNVATYDCNENESVQWRGNIPAYLIHASEENNK